MQEIMTILKKDSATVSHSANHIQTIPHSLNKYSTTISGISFCLSARTHKISNLSWIIDMDATNHMVCNTSLLTHVTFSCSYSVILPNGESVSISHIGTVRLTNTITLHNVLCVPSFSFNFLSGRKLTEQLNCCVIFLPQLCFI